MANVALNKGDMALFDILVGFGKVSEEEKKYAKDVEIFMQRKGFKQFKWARATFVMTFIFTIMTCLVHFYKPDFVNLTVCAVAIHLLSNAKDARPEQFRYLVAGTILSFGYDVLWLLLKGPDYAGDDEEEGGVEAAVRRFSLIMTIIALVFKFVMTFVYWMASMRFEDIIDERSALL